MDDDDLSSDTSDDDYIPDAGEQVSEEEESGVDEDYEANSSCHTDEPCSVTSPVKVRKNRCRKNTNEEQPSSKESTASLTSSAETAQQKKQKADALWADFMKDVGTVSKPASSVNSSTTPNHSAVSDAKQSSNSKSSADKPNTVKITKEFDFAGETVKIVKDISANSKEAEQLSSTDQQSEPDSSTKNTATSSSLCKRPASSVAGGGLSSLMDKIGKKPKISVLDKSKLDWDGFKQVEGISDEIKTHNRGKDGYLERQAFLQRTDYRQFEIERNLRLSSAKR